MKKILIFIISLFICNQNISALSASSYIVMDTDNYDVIMGDNIHEKHLIASTSKIMTCIIAIENGDLDKMVEADESILKAVGSSIYIEIGEKISLKDLLYGMMLRSGNDAATLIASNVSGSMEKFVELMNEKAIKLKMENTNFVNSHGLENDDGIGNTSTAYDMGILTSYAMQNKTFRQIFSTEKYTAKSDKKTYTWKNKNKLLRYDYVTGGKTGYTKKAHRTLVTTGSIDNKNVVIVTLNDGNDWNDHKNLYNIIKEKYKKIDILKKDNFTIKEDGVYKENTLYIKNSYSKIIPNDNNPQFQIKYYLKNKRHFNNNDNIGSANIYLNDKLIHSEPIYIKIDKEGFFTKVTKWFKNLFS